MGLQDNKLGQGVLPGEEHWMLGGVREVGIRESTSTTQDSPFVHKELELPLPNGEASFTPQLPLRVEDP